MEYRVDPCPGLRRYAVLDSSAYPSIRVLLTRNGAVCDSGQGSPVHTRGATRRISSRSSVIALLAPGPGCRKGGGGLPQPSRDL